jgi:hypothetical protein
MGKALLVNSELETGAEIVEALDEAGLNVNVAIWATLSEYGGERLILSSRRFDDESPIKAYGKVLEALHDKGIPHRQIPPLLVLRMKDPFIQELRKLFGKTKSVAGMRLGGQSFGNRFVEEGYVYRIS